MVVMDQQYEGIKLEQANGTSPSVLKNGHVHTSGQLHNSTSNFINGINNISQSISDKVKELPTEIILIKDKIVNKNYFLLGEDMILTDEEQLLKLENESSIASNQLIKKPIGIKDNETGLDSFDKAASNTSQNNNRFRSLSSPSLPGQKSESSLESLLHRSKIFLAKRNSIDDNSNNNEIELKIINRDNQQQTVLTANNEYKCNNSSNSIESNSDINDLRIRSYSVGANERDRLRSTASQMPTLNECQEILQLVKEEQKKNTLNNANNHIILVTREGCQDDPDGDHADKEIQVYTIQSAPIPISSNTQPRKSSPLKESSVPSPKQSRPMSPDVVRVSSTPIDIPKLSSSTPTTPTLTHRPKPVPPPRSPLSLRNSTNTTTTTTTNNSSSLSVPNSVSLSTSSSKILPPKKSTTSSAQSIGMALAKSKSSGNIPIVIQKQQLSSAPISSSLSSSPNQNAFQMELKHILQKKSLNNNDDQSDQQQNEKDQVKDEQLEDDEEEKQQQQQPDEKPQKSKSKTSKKIEQAKIILVFPTRKIKRSFNETDTLCSLKEYVESLSIKETGPMLVGQTVAEVKSANLPKQLKDYELVYTIDESKIKISNFNHTFKDVGFTGKTKMINITLLNQKSFIQ